jgi:hypothetical protein
MFFVISYGVTLINGFFVTLICVAAQGLHHPDPVVRFSVTMSRIASGRIEE